MRLAANSFTLQLGEKSFDLKPTLRAAFNLNIKYAGFHNLSRYLAEGSITTAVDLINTTIIDQNSWAAYVFKHGKSAVRDLIAARDQLLDLVMVLAGNDQTEDKPNTGKPISFEEYHSTVFRIATGWLGWTPDQAWNATIPEIINAYRGRREMLKAIFGGNDDDKPAESITDIRDDLNAIGDLTNHHV
jgi:hypothetical protein